MIHLPWTLLIYVHLLRKSIMLENSRFLFHSHAFHISSEWDAEKCMWADKKILVHISKLDYEEKCYKEIYLEK